MHVYVLYYENESSDRFVNGVLGYRPSKEELMERYKDCGDVDCLEDLDEDDREPYFSWDDKEDEGFFRWGSMSVEITKYEVEEDRQG